MNGINSNITQPAGVFTGAYAKRQQEAHKTGLSISKDQSESLEQRQIADIFKRYGLKGDFTTTLDMIKKQFEDYASGNSEDKGFRQYVSDEATGLFDDMQKYWASLMDHVNGHS